MKSGNKIVNQLLTKYRTAMVLLVLLIISSFISKDFLSFDNLMNVVRQVTVIAVLACGMTFVILTSGIDLSVGAPISINNPVYRFLGRGVFLNVPVPILILIVIYAIAFVILHYTGFGRSTYALGGNKEATRLSGINVKKVELIVYGISGLLAGLGGILLTARLGSGQPTAGNGYELDAIAAVILGGTSLSGGSGFVLPTVVGAIILGILDNILVLMNVNPFISNVVKGIVILLAVLIDRKFKDLSMKTAS